jgi:hypothetical protein
MVKPNEEAHLTADAAAPTARLGSDAAMTTFGHRLSCDPGNRDGLNYFDQLQVPKQATDLSNYAMTILLSQHRQNLERFIHARAVDSGGTTC